MLVTISPGRDKLPGWINLSDLALERERNADIIALCPLCIDPSYKLPNGGSRSHACPARQSASIERLELFRDLRSLHTRECFTLEEVKDIEFEQMVEDYDDYSGYELKEGFPVGSV